MSSFLIRTIVTAMMLAIALSPPAAESTAALARSWRTILDETGEARMPTCRQHYRYMPVRLPNRKKFRVLAYYSRADKIKLGSLPTEGPDEPREGA